MRHSELRGTRASDHIDLIRGLAALAVLYCHARVVLIRSIGAEISPIERVLYALSRYGQSAVIVFFVLSGYLVGGSVIRATASGRWSWGDYLLARCTRIYLVLVPALLLTMICDQISLEVVAGVQGNDDTAIAIVTATAIAARHGPIPFLGNLACLQTIAVPSYGSNTALWSLANEAWYYVIFPCLWLTGSPRQTARKRVFHAALALVILAGVGRNVVILFPAWLLGAGLALSPRIRLMRSRWVTIIAAAPLLAVLGLFGLQRIPDGYATRYAEAGTFALALFAILHRSEPGGAGLYSRLATLLAGCSYTLYLTHLPALICMRAFWTYQRPWPSDVGHWIAVGLVCFGCLTYAFLLSLITEAKTDRARLWLAARLRRADKLALQQSLIHDTAVARLTETVRK